MSYSIKVLADKEFDRLPYSRVREAFGVTSPDKQNIYVRYTNLHDFNKMLVNHELDHLVEEVPTDEGPDGERYFLGTALSWLAKTALPAIGSFATKTVPNFFTSTIPKAAQSIGSNLGGAFNTAKSGVMNLFGSGGGQTAARSISPAAAITPFSGFNPSTALSASKSGWNASRGFNPLSMFGMGGGGGGTTSNDNNKIFGLSRNALGAGMIGAGLLKSYPKVPAVSDSLNQVRGMAQQGGSPLGQQAQGVLSSRLGAEFEPMSEPEIQAALHGLELEKKQALDRVHDLYRNLRPGTDPSSDSSYRRDIQELEDQFARASSDILATRTRDIKQNFDAQRSQDIQQALGASAQEMEYLYNIALQDDARIMAELGLDAQQAQAFKDTFLNLGASLIRPPGIMDQFAAAVAKMNPAGGGS